MMSSSFTADLGRFWRDESGVALVEFALVLPMMLVVFAVIIEGSRLMMSYESAISGVRDATRYLARTVDAGICSTGGSVTGYAASLKTLVEHGATGSTIFAPNVTVGTVTPSYRCVTGSYRNGPVPVAQVTAQITVLFPFGGIFTLVGGDLPTLTTTVTDQARVFGS
jgi:Flp pilus assembly protein TadG